MYLAERMIAMRSRPVLYACVAPFADMLPSPEPVRTRQMQNNYRRIGIRVFGRRTLNMGIQVQGRDLASFGESRAIPIFLLATLLISSLFYFLIVKSGHMGGGWGAYVAGLMWSPGFAALLTCKLLRRDLRGVGWGWGKTKYEVIGTSSRLDIASLSMDLCG